MKILAKNRVCDSAKLLLDSAHEFKPELGYFSLEELKGIRGHLGLPVERDRHFEPTPLRMAWRRPARAKTQLTI